MGTIVTNLLAFDTASPRPAVVLIRADHRVFEHRLPADRQASERLFPGLANLLDEAGTALDDCNRIAVCAGPGSFTGVRVGLAAAWGLGRTLGIPVESVPTLEALAETIRAPGVDRVAAVLDAGRGEVVFQVFTVAEARARALSEAQRLSPGEAVSKLRGEQVAALPEDLLGIAGRTLPISPARAVALAVKRAPRVGFAAPPMAIYSRASAAEEKLGAS